MESFLILAGTATWFVAVFTFMVATMPVYTSAAFVMFLIGTVFVVGGVLLTAVNSLRNLLEDRLPKPPRPPAADSESSKRTTDWSAWRRDHAKQTSDEASQIASDSPGSRKSDD
jgi:hypothetical protein